METLCVKINDNKQHQPRSSWKQYTNYIEFIDELVLESNKQRMQKYKSQDQDYKVIMNFWGETTLDFKNKSIDMIEQFKAAEKVVTVQIGLESGNQLDEQIIQRMIDQYHNINRIVVYDFNEQVDKVMHGQIQKLVEQQEGIVGFTLMFQGGLNESDDGVKLIQQYSQIVQGKSGLEHLEYGHSKVELGCARSKEAVLQVLHQVTKI